MNDLFKRNLRVTAAVHLAVIVVLLVVPAIMNWHTRKKPHEIVTYVDIQAAVTEAPPVLPEVKPPEPPKDIPEPPKKKKIEVSKKKIKRKDEPEKKKTLTPDEIKKMLDVGARPTKASRRPADDLPAWYYSLIRQKMYEAWDQPSELSASAGLVTQVSIRIQKGGYVTRRKMTRSSGSRLMDDSVMQAVHSVTKLKPLPPPFTGKYKDVTVDFELTRGM